jgi:hypothetical protein
LCKPRLLAAAPTKSSHLLSDAGHRSCSSGEGLIHENRLIGKKTRKWNTAKPLSGAGFSHEFTRLFAAAAWWHNRHHHAHRRFGQNAPGAKTIEAVHA